MIRGIRPIDDRDRTRFPRCVKDVVRNLAHARKAHLGKKIEIVFVNYNHPGPVLFQGRLEPLRWIIKHGVENRD